MKFAGRLLPTAITVCLNFRIRSSKVRGRGGGRRFACPKIRLRTAPVFSRCTKHSRDGNKRIIGCCPRCPDDYRTGGTPYRREPRRCRRAFKILHPATVRYWRCGDVHHPFPHPRPGKRQGRADGETRRPANCPRAKTFVAAAEPSRSGLTTCRSSFRRGVTRVTVDFPTSRRMPGRWWSGGRREMGCVRDPNCNAQETTWERRQYLRQSRRVRPDVPVRGKPGEVVRMEVL